jgi:malate permease and related proteins
MESAFIIFQKILYIILLFAAGFIAKRFRLLSDKGEEDMSRIFVDIFWPSLIFFSITSKMTQSDIIANATLPFYGILTGLTGYVLALFVARMHKFQGDRKRIYIYHLMINNFSFMVFPLAVYFLPEKGAGMLFIHNLGFTILLLSLGVIVMSGKYDFKSIFNSLLSPALIATVLSIVIVLLGINRYIPKLVFDVFETLGMPTVALALLVAGARIYALGLKVLRFDTWNISLGIFRLIVIPGILFAVSMFMKVYLNVSHDILVIFMLVNIMPVSINSVSLAMKYNSSADIAAEGVVFTHLFSIVTVMLYILIMQKYLFN